MRDLEGARVLVTGAAGFVGSAVVRSLSARGAEPIALVRPGRADTARGRLLDVPLVEVDLEDVEPTVRAVVGQRPDAVVNLAVSRGHPGSLGDRRRSVLSSVVGTWGLLEGASSVEVARFVQVGSSLEYGQRERPLRETDALEPVTARGAAKAAASVLVLQAARDGAPVVVLRPFSVYGQHEPETRLVPSALRAALTGAVLPLTAAPVAHDFVYVDDVADAVLAALVADERVHGRALNVATGVQTTNAELVALVEEVTGRQIRVDPGAYPARSVDTSTWVADVTLARELLGWEATTSLRDGIARTLEWVMSPADAR